MAKQISFRISDELKAKIDELFKIYDVKGDSTAERWRNYIDLAYEKAITPITNEVSNSKGNEWVMDDEVTNRPICNYLDVSEETGKWFCDGKPLKDPIQCIGRYRRYQAVNLKCYP